jgi:diguanylate cyclase (GGDEF)-like protein
MKMAAVATAAGVAYALGWLSRQSEVVAARREANTDALTHLVNRKGLKRQLRHWADRGQPYTLYLIDLNDFKPVNDTYGHRAGDRLLQGFARRLSTALPQHLVARLGGDEFVVAAEGLQTGPELLLAQIQSAAGVAIRIDSAADPIGLSAAIGFVHARPGADPRAVLHTADLAMYRSTQCGIPCRAPAVIGDPVDESPRSRIRDARPVRVV